VSEAPLAGRLALARSATDRAAHRRGDADWLAGAWSDQATRVLRVGGGRALVLDEPDHGGLALCAPAETPPGERFLLGVDDAGVAYFANHEPVAPEPAPGTHAAGLRDVGALLDDRDAGLFVLAVGLANWHDTHPRCPRCGTPTVVEQAGYIRRCPNDDSEHYPRTDPAVIMLVTDSDGDRCLLGSSTRWPGPRFSTLAGFVEPGESAEAAVVREIGEEAGVAVTDVRYLGSQPWPFPSSLMLGFTARVGDPAAEPAADGAELEEVRWFDRRSLAAAAASGEIRLPPPVSIARRLIEHWYGGELVDGAGGW
jgi:NAD+ diphosphatase